MNNRRTENLRTDVFKNENQQIWAMMSMDIENEIIKMLKEVKGLIEIYDYTRKERKKLLTYPVMEKELEKSG